MRAKLHEVKAELRRRRHLPIPEQGRWLASVVRGHFAYYAVPDNSEALSAFRNEVMRHWLRSASAPQPAHPHDLGTHAPPRRPMATPAPHPPSLAQRALRRQNPRQEPSALDAHAGICAGGRQQWRSLPRL